MCSFILTLVTLIYFVILIRLQQPYSPRSSLDNMHASTSPMLPQIDELGGPIIYNDPHLSDEREVAILMSQGYHRVDAVRIIFERNIHQLQRINSSGQSGVFRS